jgi:hypothetical protein
MQIDDSLGELRFRGEVVVEAALAHVGGGAQLVDADGMVAAFEE